MTLGSSEKRSSEVIRSAFKRRFLLAPQDTSGIGRNRIRCKFTFSGESQGEAHGHRSSLDIAGIFLCGGGVRANRGSRRNKGRKRPVKGGIFGGGAPPVSRGGLA